MPRVTVNKDLLAVTPLPSPVPSPAPELTQPELLSDAPPPIQEAPVTPSPAPAPAVQQIIRQIKTVLIKVPLCDNPPGLDGTPSFCKAHVNLQLIKSRSATGRRLLPRLWWALKETGAKLGNGRKVFNRNDAVVWLIEQLQERP
jgi:hypothetical protein